MMSNIVKQMPGKWLWLQHSDELLRQNSRAFHNLFPSHPLSLFCSFQKNYMGDVVFGMQKTTFQNIDNLPPFDGIAIDEAHRTAAESYKSVVERYPNAHLLGVTATAGRGDGADLGKFYNVVSDQIEIGDLVNWGYLKTPRILRPSVESIQNAMLSSAPADYDAADIGAVSNYDIPPQEMYRHWEEFSNRKTIIFTSTVDRCTEIQSHFPGSIVVHHKVRGRDKVIEAFKSQKTGVLINPMMLTEGFDDPDVSCIIIDRSCVFKGTYIQIIGRALRLSDLFDDAIILDFRTEHEDISIEPSLDVKEKKDKEKEYKDCPKCDMELPKYSRRCPGCGYEFVKVLEEEDIETRPLTDLELKEINLTSKIKIVDLFGNGKVLVGCTENNWGAILKGVVIVNGEKVFESKSLQDCIACLNVKVKGSKVPKAWMSTPATRNQSQFIARLGS
jgi:superfamily II DNA or RNA helicase